MPQCAFRNCRNNYRKCKLADGISYFRFPNNPFRSAEWVAIVATERAEEYYKPTKNSVICSEHFDSNDIIGNIERRRLNKTAVPKFKIQSIPQEEVIPKRQSKTYDKAYNSHTPDSQTIDEMDSPEHASFNDQEDMPPSSPSTSASEAVSVSESLKVEYLQKKLTYCRTIIQQKSTTISNLQKVNKNLENQNNTLKTTIDFLLNHFQGNTIGKHFLENYD